VLTGINVGTYDGGSGVERPPALPGLVRRIWRKRPWNASG